MEVILLIGRILFSAIFILSGVNHFRHTGMMAQYSASKGVPAPRLAVLGSGAIALVGGLSILLGTAPRVGAILIVIFLVPVAFMIHNFWTVQDPMQRQVEQAMFMKNLSMAGGACLIYYFASVHPEVWPYSLGR